MAYFKVLSRLPGGTKENYGNSAEIRTVRLPNTSQKLCSLSQLSRLDVNANECWWIRKYMTGVAVAYLKHCFCICMQWPRIPLNSQSPGTGQESRKQNCLPLSHDILCLTFSLIHFCQARFIGNEKRMRVCSMTWLLSMNCSAFSAIRKAYSYLPRIFFSRVHLPYTF
jgi:hypothetical protein